MNLRQYKYLITGATGFLGSHLLAHCLQNGITVLAAGRSKNNQSTEQRIRERLAWFGESVWPAAENNLLATVTAVMEAENWGLYDPETVFASCDEIIHCAADTSFRPADSNSVRNTNLHALDVLEKYLPQSGCRALHYISTAYSAGQKRGTIPERLHTDTTHFNDYEASKAAAENRIFEICREAGVHCNIIRPAIVYGDSQSGATFRFNAFYFPIRIIDYLTGIFKKDIHNKTGQNAERLGIRYIGDENKQLRFPLRLPGSVDTGISMVPVDYFTETCMSIIEKSRTSPEEPAIYQISSQTRSSMQNIITYVEEYFHLSGIEEVSPELYNTMQHNPLEKLFYRYINWYEPYMYDYRIFETTNTEQLLGRNFGQAPPFDRAMFKRCIDYAKANNWS